MPVDLYNIVLFGVAVVGGALVYQTVSNNTGRGWQSSFAQRYFTPAGSTRGEYSAVNTFNRMEADALDFIDEVPTSLAAHMRALGDRYGASH